MLSPSNLQSKRTGLQPPTNPTLDSKKMPEEKQESLQTSPDSIVATKTVTATTDATTTTQTEVQLSDKPTQEAPTVGTNTTSDIGSKSLVDAKHVTVELDKTEENSSKTLDEQTHQIQEQKTVVDKVVEETARLSIEAKTNESKVGEAAENVTVTEAAKETVTEINSVKPTDTEIEDKSQLVKEGQKSEVQTQIVEASKTTNFENAQTQEAQSKIEESKKRGIHEISKIDDPAKIDQNADPTSNLQSETQDITRISTGSKKQKVEEPLQNSSNQVVQNASSSETKPDMTESNVATSNPEIITKEKIESQSSKTITNEAKPIETEAAQVAQKQSKKTDNLEKAYFNSVNGDEHKAKEVVQNPETANDTTTVQKDEKSTTKKVQKDEASSTSMDCKI